MPIKLSTGIHIRPSNQFQNVIGGLACRNRCPKFLSSCHRRGYIPWTTRQHTYTSRIQFLALFVQQQRSTV